MNTLEIKYQGKIKSWEDFVKTAKQQFINYEKLEGRNWKEYDFSIDCSEDQMLFKDMLQIRCIEELTEASVAFKEEDKEHFFEEITDALNFFISACVMVNYKFKKPKIFDVYYPERFSYLDELDIHHIFYVVIEKIGYLCNLLKNRPWAQSNYLVSMLDFNERLDDLYDTFWDMLESMGLNLNKIYELFERKYEVNKWRIQTGY